MRKLNSKNLIAALAVAVSVALPAVALDASGPERDPRRYP